MGGRLFRVILSLYCAWETLHSMRWTFSTRDQPQPAATQVPGAGTAHLSPPGLAAQLAPNFPLWLSLSPLVPAWTYRGLYSKYNTAYFSSMGSLSSPSQAESRGLFSTWKSPIRTGLT